MKVPGAYSLVVLIWSTTPLAIHWSNSSLTFVTAITLRMVLALVACYAVLIVLRKPLVQDKKDWRVFALSAIGLFPNMLLIYWAAQHISSGLMSIILGLYPFFVGLFAWAFFRENFFTPTKVIAIFIALSGLAIIHLSQINIGLEASLGVAAMVLVCILWGISSVWVKRLGQNIEPVRQGAGSLLVATPFFVFTWLLIDGRVPEYVDAKSMFGVAYLVLAGSVVGHTLFFYILRKCTVVTVSLITLLSPVFAVSWGVLFEGESLTLLTLIGGALILISLAVFQGVHAVVLKKNLLLYRVARPVVVTTGLAKPVD